MREKTLKKLKWGGFTGSRDILFKNSSKVPFPQLTDPTPSQEEALMTARPDSDPRSCFTHSLLVPTSVWGGHLLGGGVHLSSRDVEEAPLPN